MNPRTALISKTRTSFIHALGVSADAPAWREFDQRYRGLLLNFSLRIGLSDADAADVAQETLTRFLIAFREGKYDPERGRLRSWLVAIARGRIGALRERAAVRRVHRGESAIVVMPDERSCDEAWEQARRQTVIQHALSVLPEQTQIDERTMRAFDLVALRGAAPAVAAEQLDMTVHDVYQSKSRVLQQLRRIIDRLEREFEELPA
jgi:RNA polymerase sigma-70 factor, ECF subfamily